MALNTGLRRGELFRLRWEDIDLEGRKIKVSRTKNNEYRIVPINEELLVELKKLSRHPDSEFIFCNRDGIPYNMAVSQEHHTRL